MIYFLSTRSSPPYNGFLVLPEYWEQAKKLYDSKKYLEIINSENPFSGNSLKENWEPLKVELKSKSKSRKIGDISEVHIARCPVFSEKARNILGDFLNENGEFLEIECIDNGKIYYLYNVLTYLDIIDDEKSDSGWYFKKDVDFDKLSIFKIISRKHFLKTRSNIYLSQKFIERVIKNKLTGLSILEPGYYVKESVTNKEQLEKFIQFNNEVVTNKEQLEKFIQFMAWFKI
jgi:hypothetical protein